MVKNVVFVAAEVFPFAKVGGLADVAGALPKALYELGVDIVLFMPYYGDVKKKADDFGISDAGIAGLKVKLDDKVEEFQLFQAKLPDSDVPIYFVANERLFGREGVYLDPVTKKPFPDTAERLVFFQKAVFEAVVSLGINTQILHVNDNHTALMPAFLKLANGLPPNWSRTKSLLTIHNLAYQGVFDKDVLDIIGLGWELFYPTGPFEFYGKVNFLKVGIIFADAVNTVSPTYKEEIQTPEFGEGLDGVLREHADKLFGILNGVDYSVWDPRVDKFIPHHYWLDDLTGKAKMKKLLLKEYDLPYDAERPLIGMISRMTEQKGYDLLADAIDELMELDLQLVILGSGDPKYEKFFIEKSKAYPEKLGVKTGFHAELAHYIEAGSDMFLMPSRFEPCGLNQMYSMRYGTPPIAHKVGGIADTVVDADENPELGTGFLFTRYDADALLKAVQRALMAFRDRERWLEIMQRGMKMDFSWESSARNYLKLYNEIYEGNL